MNVITDSRRQRHIRNEAKVILRKETIGICLVLVWILTLAAGVFVSLEDVSHPVSLSDFSARQRY